MESSLFSLGPETAHLWYSRGCRTLAELKAGKGGVVLTPVQEIGLEFYDGQPRRLVGNDLAKISLHFADIIQKMPREETKALFDLIKPKGVLKGETTAYEF
jgi:DNA polymerase lambda